MLILIDNYDSFSFNLFQEISKLLQPKRESLAVFRNDKITVQEVQRMQPRGIVISPGPGGPADAGISAALVKDFAGKVPLLGVCLGHQVIAQVYGAKVAQSPCPRHGKTSLIHHTAHGLFRGVANPLRVARYHSLCVAKSELPAQLEVQAEADDGTIMALKHRSAPLFGVQFHPESFLTEDGSALLANFLKECD